MSDELQERLSGMLADDRWDPAPVSDVAGRAEAARSGGRRLRRVRQGAVVAAAVVLVAGVGLGVWRTSLGGNPTRVSVASPSTAVPASVATPSTKPCGADQLAATPSWLSPLTGQDDIAVTVTNTARVSCVLAGSPSVVMTAAGLSPVGGRPGIPGLSGGSGPVQLRPGSSARFVVAATVACYPSPASRYNHLRFSVPGGGTLSVILPSHTGSGHDLTLPVSRACAPRVGDFTASSQTATTQAAQCLASQLAISYAEAKGPYVVVPAGSPGPGVLYSVSSSSAVYPLLVRNISARSCDLHGYMLPIWDNLPGAPSLGSSQQTVAGHAILNKQGSGPLIPPETVHLAGGRSAAFIVEIGADQNNNGTVPPGGYAPPGDTTPVPAPGHPPSGRSMATFSETAVFPAAEVRDEYCTVLQGSPSCPEQPPTG